MRSAAIALGAVVLTSAGESRAQQKSVVLELYTSQGCSSCPPADALLPQLAEIPGVIALALHVDYWDYLGWHDSFASQKYTRRQRAFSKALHKRSVYTPQVVVQGQDVLVGHQATKILASLENHLAAPSPVDLEISRDGDVLTIELDGGLTVPQPLDIHLVSFVESDDVSIEAGENAGRTMTYTNIVTDWLTVGHWDGIEPTTIQVEDVDPDPVVVIVQQAGTGPVITAAELR
jgi:hypothetical protein